MLSHDGDTVFVGSFDQAFYALAASDGALRWKFLAGDAVDANPAMSADGGLLFFGSFDRKVSKSSHNCVT